MSNRSESRVVYPGEILGVEEEFIPEQGVYTDRYGYLRSQIVGRVLFDYVRKNIFVRKLSYKPLLPKPGDIVEGIVSSVSEDIAFISIYAINDKYSRSIDLTGILHVSQASLDYIENLYEAVRSSEVVRARVLNSNYPYQLTTKEPALGVMIAYCSLCGGILYRRDDKLMCNNCGSIEKRKMSSFYAYR